METYAHTDLNPLRRPQRARAAGFSLVEIAMALAIIAFAFVTVFGLLPSGLTIFRRAMDISICSQVADRLINESQQTDFSELIKRDVVLRYFDEQGNEQPDVNSDTIYQGRILVQKKTSFPGAPDNDNLATVTVQVANNPGRRVLKTDLSTGLWNDPAVNITTANILVARQK